MLNIQARSGISSGWKPTNAAFFLSVLRADYGDQFGWNEIEEFKRLNNIEDWVPYEDLSADGVLIPNDGSGQIRTPEGFDIDSWQQYYAAWKNGEVVATLPPEIEAAAIFSTPTFTPSPVSNPAAAPQPVPDQMFYDTNAPAITPSTTGPGGVPMWAWALGGALGVAALAAMFKGKRKK